MADFDTAACTTAGAVVDGVAVAKTLITLFINAAAMSAEYGAHSLFRMPSL